MSIHTQIHTYLHEIKESSFIVQYVSKINVATCKNINLVLTVKITSQKIVKVPATKQLITIMFWKWIFNAHHLKSSCNYTRHLLHCFKTLHFVHAAHLCFIPVSRSTIFISLNSSTWLVFEMDMDSVLCDVQIGIIIRIHIQLIFSETPNKLV